jgi:hypothetical protein
MQEHSVLRNAALKLSILEVEKKYVSRKTSKDNEKMSKAINQENPTARKAPQKRREIGIE